MLSLRIALRYLLSRKSHGVVNVISAVAMAGVAVAAAAMIIVLSVFNGFADLVTQKTSNFNPPLLVKTTEGKTIADADSLARLLGGAEGVILAAPMIDEQAFAISEYGQMPVNLRALPPEALPVSGLGQIVIDGNATPTDALLSVGVAMSLGLRPGGEIMVYEPRRVGRINPANPMNSFRADSLTVSGVYQVEQEEQDRDMLIIPLADARRLLDYTTEASAIAVYTTASDVRPLKARLQAMLAAAPAPDSGEKTSPATGEEAAAGDSAPQYQVLDRLEQEAEAFRMIAIEKWITFLMLLFILAVASFNIISTLSLMVVEKQQNMEVMASMGATPSFIRRIFANQAWLITLGGGIIGMAVGSLLALGQMHFGWVKLSSANPALMAIDHYPVRLEAADLLLTFVAIILTCLLLTLLFRSPIQYKGTGER